MVKSRMALDFMKKGLKEALGKGFWEDVFAGDRVKIAVGEDGILIVVPVKKLSQFLGQKRCNLRELEKVFSLQKLKIIGE